MGNSREDLVEYTRTVLEQGQREVNMTSLSEACYSFSERGLFGDSSLSAEDAVRIWALVERVRRQGGFPERLRM